MNQTDNLNISSPTEVWVVASKRKDGTLPSVSKILGMQFPDSSKYSKFGESVLFCIQKDAETFLNSIDNNLRKHFTVYKAWIEIKEEINITEEAINSVGRASV